jgi:hypothetical protein
MEQRAVEINRLYVRFVSQNFGASGYHQVYVQRARVAAMEILAMNQQQAREDHTAFDSAFQSNSGTLSASPKVVEGNIVTDETPLEKKYAPMLEYLDQLSKKLRSLSAASAL